MEDYVFEDGKIIDKTDEERETELFVSIMKAKKELDEASKNFEFAEDDLIDYYTYQIKATRAKFDYLVKKAKSQGLVLDSIKQFKLKIDKAI